MSGVGRSTICVGVREFSFFKKGTRLFFWRIDVKTTKI